MCCGRSFHARAAATENDRSPRVERRVDGTSRVHLPERCAITAEPIEAPFWLWDRVGSRNQVFDGVQIPLLAEKEQFLGKAIIDDTVPSAMQKWLKRSRCRLDCKLVWAEGSRC